MECKLANTDEMKEAFAQVHVIWPHDPDSVVHLRKRLASLQHQRASWFVLVDQGAVVSSLGAYPFTLFGPGADRPARAFGAVFTPEAQRGRGHAAKLIGWVKNFYADQGCLDFILYSDIDPAYYAKLGFQTLPSYEFSWDLTPYPGPEMPLIHLPARPLDPGSLGLAFGIRRQTDEARWVQDRQQQELRLSRCLDTGNWLLSRQDHGIYTLLESNRSMADWKGFSQFLASDARQAGCQSVRGWWVAPEAPHPEWVSIRARKAEILMWSSLRERDPWQAGIGQTGFRAFLSEHV